MKEHTLYVRGLDAATVRKAKAAAALRGVPLRVLVAEGLARVVDQQAPTEAAPRQRASREEAQ